jgi:hypothetical protein
MVKRSTSKVYKSNAYPALIVKQYNPKPSAISEARGPAQIDQLNALITDNYWVVLNVKRFFNCPLLKLESNVKLRTAVNAFKHALQTFGPHDKENLPDFRDGVGKTKGSIFHGHVNGSNGTVYIIEWTIIDLEKRIMAITGFGSHENYNFVKKPLTSEMINAIFKDEDNQAILTKVAELKEQAKAKSNRMNP